MESKLNITDSVKINKVAKVITSQSLINFTCYFFKKKHLRKFVINEHHKQITNALDRVIKGEVKRLIINIAPRYGKTELAVKNFIAYCLSQNPKSRFIHLSYSDDLALDNSEEIKDLISSQDFQDLYNIQIKPDSKSKKKWYTKEGGGVYATSTGGQVTGFGAGKVDEEDKEFSEFIISEAEGFGGAIVIDDPIKPEDAESDTKRNRINERFDSTIRNRVNSRNTPIIIIMQRVHPQDLSGYLIDLEGDKWEVLSLPCVKEDGQALWPFKHTLQELEEMRAVNPVVFDRQYMQDPKPKEGLMYSDFKTYKELPSKGRVENYTDVADTGSDYLCSISYEVIGDYAYILDLVYDKGRAEETEPKVIDLLNRTGTTLSHIESNNGGRMYARNIDKGVRANVKWFHQSQNKQARIFNGAPLVNKYIIMPHDWHIRWPKFHKDVTHYMAIGKNANDDAPDVLTGITEKSLSNRVVGTSTARPNNKPRVTSPKRELKRM